jgi:hypothetical protein
VEVSVATGGVKQHDVAMELLECLGQAAWEKRSAELRAYCTLLREEISTGSRAKSTSRRPRRSVRRCNAEYMLKAAGGGRARPCLVR